MRPKFRDAVEREVRQFAVEHSQLEAALQRRRGDSLASGDSFRSVLRPRKAAVEQAEAHVQAYVRDSADKAIYFAAQTRMEITNRTLSKRFTHGYVPGAHLRKLGPLRSIACSL